MHEFERCTTNKEKKDNLLFVTGGVSSKPWLETVLRNYKIVIGEDSTHAVTSVLEARARDTATMFEIRRCNTLHRGLRPSVNDGIHFIRSAKYREKLCRRLYLLQTRVCLLVRFKQ